MQRMKALIPLQALVAAAVLFGGCAATDAGGAEQAAERFYGAVAAKDGAGACEELGEATRKQLEQDEQEPCDEAVLGIELSGERVVRASTAITGAKVELDSGDSAFLEETPLGWEVTAAGCKPTPGQESPYDCEVGS
jgi:hypothetical protein